MEYSIGDLLDRKGILNLKIEKGTPAPAQYKNIRGELDNINRALRQHEPKEIIDYYSALIKDCNEKIWDLESDIRTGNEGKLPLNEITDLPQKRIYQLAVVGQRAIQIRDINRKRIKLKNEANKKFKSGFTEYKLKHQSQTAKK